MPLLDLVEKVHPRRFIPVDKEGDVWEALRRLNEAVSGLYVDAALIGIGRTPMLPSTTRPLTLPTVSLSDWWRWTRDGAASRSGRIGVFHLKRWQAKP